MGFSKPTRATGLIALIVVLLTALTALQYGWIGQLSELQQHEMERTLRSSTERFVSDLDRELERIWYVFHVRRARTAGEEIVEDHAEWAESFDTPGLIGDVYWVREISTAATESVDRLDLQRVSLVNGEFEAAQWPPWLARLRQQMVASADDHRDRAFHESDSFTASAGDAGMAFVVAQTEVDRKSWAVVVLRREAWVERFLPALVRDHFGADEVREYAVQLFDEAEDGRIVYSSAGDDAMAASSATDLSSPDLVRHLRDYGGSFRGRETGRRRSLAVAVTHRAGSVYDAVAQLRRRNLAFSFGVILVLGTSVGVLAIAARRARRLAERQMEFVAGVSHELRTPIAGISSLSQNLADGVVQDIEHAARYGETIHQESRRLANMVEGVLHFSAIRSGRYRYQMRELRFENIVEEAIKTLDPKLVRACSLTVEVDHNLPQLRGDERALRSVVRNLVSNAMKFSGSGGEIHVSAGAPRASEHADRIEIELRVQDSGPGIDTAELPRIFEPFFRGRHAQTEQIEGSGLGLSLVKEVIDAHGGRVEVSSDSRSGSCFLVYLPAAADTASARTRSSAAAETDRLQPAGNQGDA